MSAPIPSLHATTPTYAPHRVWLWLKGLPYDHIRDAFLVIAGLLYLLGYIVWSVHAWRNNLGLLPLLDAQYLLAGLIVACILLAGTACACVSKWVSERIPGTLSSERAHTGWRRVLRKGWYAMTFLSIAGMIFLSDSDWVMPHYMSSETGMNFSFIIFVICAIFSPALESNPNSPSRNSPLNNSPLHLLIESYRGGIEIYFSRVRGLLVPFAIFILTLIVLLRSLDYYTHHWPQELAGPKPRCAYLDLEVSKLSPTTLARLLPSTTSTNALSGVVRSDRLNIFFISETLLVKPVSATQRANETYEISQSAVAATTWCAP